MNWGSEPGGWRGQDLVYLADSEGFVLSTVGTRSPGVGPSPGQGVTLATCHRMDGMGIS